MAVVYRQTNTKFLTVIQQLGLTTGLKLCLDAGDSASVAVGSQAKWLDVAGNGYDFYRGSSAAGDAAEPTFNGTPGNLSASEYFSSDGGDNFTYDSANESWMDNLHKDGAKFTICCWIWPINGANNIVCGSNGGGLTSNVGHSFIADNANVL